MDQVRIYLLTLRKRPSRGKGYFAYRLEFMDQNGKMHEKELYEEEKDITANQLALIAMYRAFEALRKPCEVEVFTDSLYLRGNFVANLENWTLNSWMNAKGEPVAGEEADDRVAAADEDGTRVKEGEQTCGISLESLTAPRKLTSWR